MYIDGQRDIQTEKKLMIAIKNSKRIIHIIT